MNLDMLNIYLPIAGIEFNVLILLAIGFAVGVLGGFFGVGGAWVVTPALNIFGFPMAYAIGTDLAHIFGKSIVATKKHGKMGNVDVKLGLYSIVGSVIGVELGARNVMWLTAKGLAGPVVRYAYMVLLFGLGIFMLYDYFTKDKKQSAQEAADMEGGPGAPAKSKWNLPPMITFPTSGVTVSLWTVLGVFFFTGWLSGFLGVGGGFIRMPALIYLIGCPTAIAIGTDLAHIFGKSIVATKKHGKMGNVDVKLGLYSIKYIHGYGIRLLFAIMIIMAGCSVALKQFDMTTIAAYCVMGAALSMCGVIIALMIQGVKKERAENA
jgi:uncharacterized membrane protein YfcA